MTWKGQRAIPRCGRLHKEGLEWLCGRLHEAWTEDLEWTTCHSKAWMFDLEWPTCHSKVWTAPQGMADPIISDAGSAPDIYTGHSFNKAAAGVFEIS